MTQHVLNPQQLAMFMPTQHVIDTVHKIDNPDAIVAGRSPRQQWEEPLPEGSMYAGESLRNAKLANADAHKDYSAMARSAPLKGYDIEKGIAESNVPPLRIQHINDRQELWDGHHRLAKLEAAGHTEIPVWHSFDEDDATPKQWVGIPRRKP